MKRFLKKFSVPIGIIILSCSFIIQNTIYQYWRDKEISIFQGFQLTLISAIYQTNLTDKNPFLLNYFDFYELKEYIDRMIFEIRWDIKGFVVEKRMEPSELGQWLNNERKKIRDEREEEFEHKMTKRLVPLYIEVLNTFSSALNLFPDSERLNEIKEDTKNLKNKFESLYNTKSLGRRIFHQTQSDFYLLVGRMTDFKQSCYEELFKKQAFYQKCFILFYMIGGGFVVLGEIIKRISDNYFK